MRVRPKEFSDSKAGQNSTNGKCVAELRANPKRRRSRSALPDARYLIVGGFAVIHHGYLRATEDIGLLLDRSLENQARVKKALETLPDKAILELGEDDLCDYTVVRVSEEILVT